MDGVIGNFIGAATVALLSGLALLAYRHPNGYWKIARPLIYLTAATFFLGNVYNIGVTSGSFAAHMQAMTEASKHGVSLSLIDMNKAVEDVTIPNLLLFGGCISLYIYLWTLHLLPDLLGIREKKQIKEKDDKTA